jgi:hypothetical protein
MGMYHDYTFFDRAVVDPLWKLSWKTVIRRNLGSRQLSSRKKRDEWYDGLIDIITNALPSEPPRKQVEKLLAKDTVKRTVLRSDSQMFDMGEIMSHVVGRNAIYGVQHRDISGILAVAAQAFLDNRINAATLWSVAKLHRSDGVGWVTLSKSQQHKIESSNLPWNLTFTPIYNWQGKAAFLGGENWIGCLGVAETRRFIAFVLKANRENWVAAPLRPTPFDKRIRKAAPTLRFRSFDENLALATTAQAAQSFERPSVFRTWG